MMGIVSSDQVISLTADVIRWLFTWSCQAFLLLGIAWVGLKLDRSRSATVRYRIWLIALLTVAGIPLFGVLNQQLRTPIIVAPFPVREIGAVALPAIIPQPTQLAFYWPSLIWPALFVLWTAGVIVSLFRLGSSLWKLHRIQSSARLVSLNYLGCSSSDLPDSEPGGLSIALSNGVQSPGLAGLFRPIILLPADIMSWTDREERTSILRHEIAHIKRLDHIASCFQAVLKCLLFFHPLLRYADHRLGLEREIACDDRVLGLGTEPIAYAEAILKAAERGFVTDVVHQTASFNSRKTLERRIEMIMNTNRTRRPLRKWPFLLLPVILIAVSAWLVMPAAGRRVSVEDIAAQPASVEIASTGQSQNPPVVNRSTIIVDIVKRGPLAIYARGLGEFVSDDSGRLKAVVKFVAAQVSMLRPGQNASIDNRYDVIPGTVTKVGTEVSDGVVAVEISLAGDLPQSAKAGMQIEGNVDTDRLENVLYAQRPSFVGPSGYYNLFRLDESGATATVVAVKFGKSSITTSEILEGLEAGDKVIVSDMSAYAGVKTIRLNP
jgi:beta-lactamase regulating signal transducer with metallopeptidase domain